MLGDAALGHANGAAAEVIAAEEVSELTRFAGNLIHQSVSERSLRLRARVIGDDALRPRRRLAFAGRKRGIVGCA